MPLLTVSEVRDLLGAEAEGQTDAQIEQLRDRFADFACAILGTCDEREMAARQTEEAR